MVNIVDWNGLPWRGRPVKKKSKKRAPTPPKRYTTTDLVEVLLSAVEAEYRGDPSTAGVCLSRLSRDRGYYGSVLRYDGPFGEGKKVVVKVYAENLHKTVEQLSAAWLSTTAVKDRLRMLLDRAQS